MRISDWSSDVCSSDLAERLDRAVVPVDVDATVFGGEMLVTMIVAVIMIVVMMMSVTVAVVVIVLISLGAQPVLHIKALGRRIIQAGIEQLVRRDVAGNQIGRAHV